MLVQGTLTTTKNQIYTCPASTKAEVKTIKIHNITTETTSVELFSKKASSLRFDSFVLNGGESIEISPSFPMVFVATEGIEGQAGANSSVTFFIGGRESVV